LIAPGGIVRDLDQRLRAGELRHMTDLIYIAGGIVVLLVFALYAVGLRRI
jgi:hypothetical protein